MEATSLRDLIDWMTDIHEPILTTHLSEDNLRMFLDSPMTDIPKLCLHTQSIERCVKQVTRAAESVYGYQRRDGFIRASAYHR